MATGKAEGSGRGTDTNQDPRLLEGDPFRVTATGHPVPLARARVWEGPEKVVLGMLKASQWGSWTQVKEFGSTLSQRLHPVCYRLEGNRQGRLQGSQSMFLKLWFLLRVALPFNLHTKPCGVKVKWMGTYSGGPATS